MTCFGGSGGRNYRRVWEILVLVTRWGGDGCAADEDTGTPQVSMFCGEKIESF